jgi:hypothetical protein
LTFTDTQKKTKTYAVYQFIAAHVGRTGRFPRTTDIAFHMGWKTTSGAQDCLLRLVIWGKIQRLERDKLDGKARFTYRLL